MLFAQNRGGVNFDFFLNYFFMFSSRFVDIKNNFKNKKILF